MSSPLVLIVEDEPDLVVTLEHHLEKEGFQTRSAFSHMLGIQKAQMDPLPDLFLLDLI